MSLAPLRAQRAPFNAKFVGTELRKHRDRVIEGIDACYGTDTHTKGSKMADCAVPPPCARCSGCKITQILAGTAGPWRDLKQPQANFIFLFFIALGVLQGPARSLRSPPTVFCVSSDTIAASWLQPYSRTGEIPRHRQIPHSCQGTFLRTLTFCVFGLVPTNMLTSGKPAVLLEQLAARVPAISAFRVSGP